MVMTHCMPSTSILSNASPFHVNCAATTLCLLCVTWAVFTGSLELELIGIFALLCCVMSRDVRYVTRQRALRERGEFVRDFKCLCKRVAYEFE